MQKIFKALVQFQHDCEAIPKDSKVKVKTQGGGEYEFEYASFGSIVQTIKEPMFKAELGYTFFTAENKFTCRVLHSSGEFIDTSIDLPPPAQKMQERGSQLTYLKRYTLVLALGLDTDADDDGNAADGNEMKRLPPAPRKEIHATPQKAAGVVSDAIRTTKNERKVTEAQINRLYKIQEKYGWSVSDLMLHLASKYRCDLVDLNMNQYDEFCNFIMNSKPDNEEIPF